MYIEKGDQQKPYYQSSLPFDKEHLLRHGTRVVCHQSFFVKTTVAPAYDIRYRYKAELNWYFDIIESNKNLRCRHVEIPVVYYSLGGFGWVNYQYNLLEWLKLIFRRYGLITLLKYRYDKILIKKIGYRYGSVFNFIFKKFLV